MRNKKHIKKLKKKINVEGKIPHQLNKNTYPTKSQVLEETEMEKRVLAFMLYKDYVGNNTITQSQLEKDMKAEGWLDIPYERILALLREKGALKS